MSPSTRTLRARPTTNWLAVRRWLRFAWTKATTKPGGAADEDADDSAPRRPVAAEGGAEGAGEEHPLDGDVQRAGPLRHPLPGGGEQEHDGQLEGADVQRVGPERSSPRAFIARSSSAAQRRRAQPSTRRIHGLRRSRRTLRGAERSGVLDRRRDEQGEHEQRLHDVGHPPVDPGGGEEARPGAQGGEHERRRDRHEDAVAGDEGDEQPVPAVVPGVADRQPVAGCPAGQQHGAGDAGEAPRSHEHGGGQRPAGHAEALRGTRIEAEDVDPRAEPRLSDDIGDDRRPPRGRGRRRNRSGCRAR